MKRKMPLRSFTRTDVPGTEVDHHQRAIDDDEPRAQHLAVDEHPPHR